MMAMVDKPLHGQPSTPLITSFMGLSRYVAGAPSGWLADTREAGHPYFIICNSSSVFRACFCSCVLDPLEECRLADKQLTKTLPPSPGPRTSSPDPVERTGP